MVEWHLEHTCLKYRCLFWFSHCRPDRWIRWLLLTCCVHWPLLGNWLVSGLFLFLLVCACVCYAVAAILLEYSEGCWEEALAIWSLLPALHNKNRHTSTPVMDDKETGTEEEVGGGGGGWEIESTDRDNKQGCFNENLKCGTSGHCACPG